MKKINKVIVERIPDYDTDLSYLGTFGNEAGKFAVKHDGNRNDYPYFNADNVENMKQAKQNYNRIMKYDSGELCDYGVKATAEVYTSQDGKSWKIDKITSGGLWGLSSDGSTAEFDSEAENQRAELTDILKEFGFSEKEILDAPVNFKNWY